MNDTDLEELFLSYTVASIGADCFAPMSYTGDITVTCYENTNAARYCYNNQVKNLTLLSHKTGDANLSGEVDVMDVTAIQKDNVGKVPITDERARLLADVNGDGNVTVRDATLIQMYVAKIITSFESLK